MPTVHKHKAHVHAPIIKQHDTFYDQLRWRKFRAIYIKNNPLCEYCLQDGYYIPGFILDHFLARRLFPELEWTTTNMMNACRTCDQTKRQLEANVYDREVLKVKLFEAGYVNNKA